MPKRKPYGIALADARIPAWWPWGVALIVFAQLYATLRKRKDIDAAIASGVEVAELLGTRAAEGDRRNDRLAALAEQMDDMTRSMRRLVQVSTATAAASLIVAVVALVLAA